VTLKCDECGGQELMEGNPYHEHVTFKCEDCGNERKSDTNHLRPDALQYDFPGNEGDRSE
jgi:uncharacterized Zn finger protein